jgi:hypothetical protein
MTIVLESSGKSNAIVKVKLRHPTFHNDKPSSSKDPTSDTTTGSKTTTITTTTTTTTTTGLFFYDDDFDLDIFDDMVDDDEEEEGDSIEYTDEEETTTTGQQPQSKPASTKDEHVQQQQVVKDHIQKFEAAKIKLVELWKSQYGNQHYRNIFYENGDHEDSSVSRGRKLFVSGNCNATKISWDRLKRKLQIKILRGELIHDHDADNDESNPLPTSLVWATGGHSATAAHGNFYDESYTAYLERSSRMIWDNGIQTVRFVGRNYAMGGTAAGAEVAMCIDAIFGTDIDILVWDFGMTDGTEVELLNLYGHRAALNRGRPILLAFHAGGQAQQRRAQVVQTLEDMGMAALISSEQVMDDAMAAIPDSFGLSDSEIQQLPPFVRNFRCGSQIENGEPYCGSEKYNMTMCTDRKGRASWHPGWKWQALMGNLAAHFVVDALEEALHDLVEMVASKDSNTLLAELQAQEDADYERFWHASAPASMQHLLPEPVRDSLMVPAKSHAYCHTARLPSEIRHRGFLTESSKTGFLTYETGIGLREALVVSSKSEILAENDDDTDEQKSQMPLVYTEADRSDCPVPVMIDYKDYFFVKKSDGWKKLVFPNDAEQREYGNGQPPSSSSHGTVAYCFSVCPWGQCPTGVIPRTAWEDGILELQVNGIPVTEVVKFQECDILKHAHGYEFPTTPEGRFEIRARITDAATDGAYARFSSFLAWF